MTTPATSKISSSVALKMYDFDPNVDTATAVAWVDMSLFGNFQATFMRTIGTGTCGMIIQTSASSDGSSPQTVKANPALNPDAVGDQIHLECSSSEIAEALPGGRYVSATITFGTSTDEGVVTYLRTNPRFAYDDLTANIIA